MEQFNCIARGIVDPFWDAVNRQWGPDLSDVPRLLVVMRGLPGSGKTTLAETIAEYAGAKGATTMICSANHFFMHDGAFVFNGDDLGRAHEACYNRCLHGLSQARDQGPDIIIVDNTNLRNRDFEVYANLPHDPDWMEVVAFECAHNEQDAAMLLNRARDLGHMIPDRTWSMWLDIWEENATDERNTWIIPLQHFMGPP
ncbi:hypothetical protein PR001_g24560 [Phytophthora rubi]|uniref:Uncharacterized protein n=1 Tax=Phytophthora rubi TaxID=129364 RepID=A0A6A3I9D5_9STRA|nr:hypothetical protein PR001_g24560 [Phytophthora rubi]